MALPVVSWAGWRTRGGIIMVFLLVAVVEEAGRAEGALQLQDEAGPVTKPEKGDVAGYTNWKQRFLSL